MTLQYRNNNYYASEMSDK